MPVGLESTASVAQGSSFDVVESDSDAALQHAPAVPGSDLEVACCRGLDPAGCEEGVVGFEGQPAGVGSERRAGGRRRIRGA